MKRIAMVLGLAGFIAGSLTAQEQFPDLKAYANAYVAQFGLTNVNWNRPPEMYETDPVENAKYATLRGNSQYLDTPFEIALYAYYSPKADAAPPAAEAILPHSNPRLVDRQLGAAVFQEIQILRFLGDTAAVNRHEAVLQFITGRGNATRAEIEAFYRNNVRALIEGVVDEEFNKPGRDNIIPARVYAAWMSRGVAQGTDAMALIKDTLTNFFLDPTQVNYERVRGIYARYAFLTSQGGDPMAYSCYDNLTDTIKMLGGDSLINKLTTEVTYSNAGTLARVPNDPRLNVFSVPYTVGGAAR
jgi:hypothetical protein